MKAAAFDYHRPASVEAAVGMLAELGDEAKVLAGGQSLVPVMVMSELDVTLTVNGQRRRAAR